MIYTIHIENWHPHTLNSFINVHHMKASKMKAADMKAIGVYGYIAKVSKATKKRKLDIIIGIAGGGRTPDPDAYYKSVNDALARLGYIKDDSSKWLDITPAKFIRKGDKFTTLVLTDIEEGLCL